MPSKVTLCGLSLSAFSLILRIGTDCLSVNQVRIMSESGMTFVLLNLLLSSFRVFHSAIVFPSVSVVGPTPLVKTSAAPNESISTDQGTRRGAGHVTKSTSGAF